VDHEGMRSLFGQGAHIITTWEPRVLRGTGRCFKAVFRGEAGEDAGGLYREAIDMMCKELATPGVPLLVKSGNGIGNIGEHRNKYLLSPAADRPCHARQLQFLGQLMGIALRTSNTLPLDLSHLVWKALCGEERTRHDLHYVDQSIEESMKALRDLDAIGVSEEDFEYVFDETFVTHDSAGRVVELVPGGAQKQLTYAEAPHFAELVENFRLHESDNQIALVRQGLATVVPVDLLSLWSWQELELQVCGKPSIDIDLLKQHTRYESLSSDSPQVNAFWEALRGFSEEDKGLFLRFVWGRSRLPLADKGWGEGFKIQHRGSNGDVDMQLPVAHTCFFMLELPAYTSATAAADRILYAIRNCASVDGDAGYGGGRRAMGMGFV